MKKISLAVMSIIALSTSCANANEINENYIKSLATTDKTVLVIEYRDANNTVITRKGFATKTGFKAVSPTEIGVNDKLKLKLFGIKPCTGNVTISQEGYIGTCDAYAKDQLNIQLKNPKVIFCVSAIAEQNAVSQTASCWGYWYFPNTLDSVSSIEQELLSNGAVKLADRSDGTPYQNNLKSSEEIGKKGKFGIWSDPRQAGEGTR